MGLGMLVFWGLIIFSVVALARSLVLSRSHRPSATRINETEAEQILAARFARGEIDDEEFQRRRESLRGVANNDRL
jgi:putative membrane protein